MEKILIAEDDTVSRKILETHLKNWGYEVISTKDGRAAWEVLEKDDSPHLAILDWMMPEMDGIEVCKKLRKLEGKRYFYVILLTAKGMNDDVVKGLHSGADDYITKPYDKSVLRARIDVGLRVIQLERLKLEQIETITKSHERTRKDLEAAGRVQSSLLPQFPPETEAYDFDWIYEPSSELGGDMLHVYSIDEEHVVFYVLDVAGHGTQAALLSVTIRNQLTNTIQTGNNFKGTQLIACENSSACEVVNQLATHYSDLLAQTGQYFTLLYGILNIKTGECNYVRAGQTCPALLRGDKIELLQGGDGLPIGMFDFCDYQNETVFLKPGDSFYIYTDGVVEAMNPEGSPYMEERFLDSLKIHRDKKDQLKNAVSDARAWTTKEDFVDDVTLLSIKRK